MPAITAEVLRVWRSSEQLLEELPSLDPDHETVRRLVVQLRELYAEVTASAERSERSVRTTLKTVEDAWLVVEGTRGRLAGIDDSATRSRLESFPG